MTNEYESMLEKLNKEIYYFPFIKYLCELEEKGIITLYAGTYSFKYALEREYCEQALFYFYFNSNKEGFCFYKYSMGCGLTKDDKIFKLSHRRLYNRDKLSNCINDEDDLRSGEYFE